MTTQEFWEATPREFDTLVYYHEKRKGNLSEELEDPLVSNTKALAEFNMFMK